MNNKDSGYQIITGAMKFFRGVLGAFVLAIVVVSVGSLEVFEVVAGAAGFGGHFPQPINTLLSLSMTGALVGMTAAIIRKDWRIVAFFAIPYLADLVIDSHGADVWMTGEILPLFSAPPDVQSMRAVFFMLSAIGDVMAGYVVVNGWDEMTKIILASFGYPKAEKEKPSISDSRARTFASGRPTSGISAHACTVCGQKATVMRGGFYYCSAHAPAPYFASPRYHEK